MKSTALVLLLVSFASCYSGPPHLVEPSPVPRITPAGGGARPAAARPARETAPCREVSRRRCAVEECGKAKTDYVTLRCADGKDLHRCVANPACTAN